MVVSCGNVCCQIFAFIWSPNLYFSFVLSDFEIVFFVHISLAIMEKFYAKSHMILRQIPESAPSKFKMTNSALVIMKMARSTLCTKET
jgi:hypothetical protein